MTSATIGSTRSHSKKASRWSRAYPTPSASPESATVHQRIAAASGAMRSCWPFWPIPPTPNTPNGPTGSAKSSTRTSSIWNTPTPCSPPSSPKNKRHHSLRHLRMKSDFETPLEARLYAAIDPAVLSGQPLVRHAVRGRRFGAQAAKLVLLVFLEVAFEPFDMRVALEGEHVRGHTVEEHAVVADDDSAAGIGFERVFQRA